MIHVAISQASGFPLTFVLRIENGYEKPFR